MAASQSTSALSPGGSAVLTVPSTGTWATITASYTCSVTTDTAANAWLEGSIDAGTTFFPLNPTASTLPSASSTSTGARFYTGQLVNAVRVHVTCSSGNTVTVYVNGE